MSDLAADLALLHGAALRAGAIAQGYFRRDPQVQEKPGGAGPVTQADLEIDAMLRRDLLAARPDYGWLSEESPDAPDRLTRRRVFVVDPIDGTRAFIDGQPGFAHALAIVEDGAAVAALVHLPMLGLTYAAVLGQGATLNDAAMRVSERAQVPGARVLAARAPFHPDYWPGGVPDVARDFRPSLAWRMALVAEGAFDAMLTLRPTWHWDCVAGALLVAEAGGQVSDAQGAPLRFNTPDPRAAGVIAGGSALHSGLVALRG
jgi:myo-inositol-1(or 4)-monophosphatase